MNSFKVRKNINFYKTVIYITLIAFFLFSCDELEGVKEDSSDAKGNPTGVTGDPTGGTGDPTPSGPTNIEKLKEILGDYNPALNDVLTPIIEGGAKTIHALYVSVDGGATGDDSTRMDGSTWEKAYPATELKTAIDIASASADSVNPYLVVVAPGTYNVKKALETTNPLSSPNRRALEMSNNVAIIGGLAKDGSLSNEKTIFDGDYSTQVFTNYKLDSTALLYRVTITKGKILGDNGGGMVNYSANPSIIDVTFSDNTATAGGGMYNNDSSPKLTDVKFLNNTVLSSASSIGNGGGMYNVRSSPSLMNVTFSGNKAEATDVNQEATAGGGMYNALSLSSPSLTSVTFFGNTASRGGGMFNAPLSSPSLKDVTFSSNTASISGGGMYNSRSFPSIRETKFLNNTAPNGGGILHDGDGRKAPVITDSILWGNTAESGGPQIYVYNDTGDDTGTENLIIRNSVLEGGVAGIGYLNPAATAGDSPEATDIDSSGITTEYNP